MDYRYCRFHAIFDDEMDVVRRDEKTGKLIFQWHQVDKVYDALLKLGLHPFVELNPMPKVMASGTQRMFHYNMNVTPPKDYNEWELLVSAFTGHVVERYGLDEVRKWYFEVWNEPNLSGFWSDTQDDYWKLYTASAKTVKGVDAQLKIGGPASSKGNWIKEIISFTTKNKVPLDFVRWVPIDIFDEGGIPQSPCSCTYGLMSIHGIPKASFNAFRLLRKMTGIIMDVKPPIN